MKKIKNIIPNLLTITRIVSCFLGAIFLIKGNISTAIGCYTYGALSDAFDGYLARKLDAVTEIGKKLDPISDKLYALSLISPSIILGNYLMIIPLIFEGIISAINIYANAKYQKTHTEKIGKMKTILLFPTMILGLLVTKIPNLYVIFLPLIFLSTKLQAKSIRIYFKQLDENKIQKTINEDKLNDSYNNLKINKNINVKKEENKKENTISNNKKLVRKKEYNDRY